jgi:L-rhamnose isomerase
MRGPQPSSIITVEELVEEHIVPKVRVTIKLFVSTIGRAAALYIASKDVNEPMLNLIGNLGEVHVVAATSGALNLQIAAIVLVEPLQRLNQQEVYGQLIKRMNEEPYM